MDKVRNRQTGTILTHDELRKSFPSNKLLPAMLTKQVLDYEGYDPIFNAPPPSLRFDEIAVLDGAKLEMNANNTPTGNWIQKWSIVKITPEELTTKTIAFVRDFERMVVVRVQKRLDDFAHSRGYGDEFGNGAIMSVCSYANSGKPKYRAEAEYCIAAREATWNKIYELQALVNTQQIAMPGSYAEVEAQLPPLVWPSTIPND